MAAIDRAGVMDWLSEAIDDPGKLQAALLVLGFLLAAAALALSISKALGAIFRNLHGRASNCIYYSILAIIGTYGFAAMFVAFWKLKPPVGERWLHAGNLMMWFGLLMLVVVTALGGLKLIL